VNLLKDQNEDKVDISQKIENEYEAIDSYIKQHVSRISFIISVLIIGGLFSVLSQNIASRLSWVIFSIAFILLIPLLISILRHNHERIRTMTLFILAIITIGLISSVIYLIYSLFTHSAHGTTLFRDAAILWLTNILVFASCYWEIDQGGPQHRHHNPAQPIDLLFPQLITNFTLWSTWKPSYIDYVFFAFNTSTAFSPTDTMVMSRRTKLLVMTQSAISLVILAVLAARAINIA
jgi:uncharacterized membrane protein